MAGTLHATTTTLLLERLRDPRDESVWHEFDARYRPILVGIGVRMGLGPDDAEEVSQETLVQFARDYREGRYDRGKGQLRAWLIGICRHRVIDACRQRARVGAHRGESALVDLPDEESIETAWEQEQRRAIFERAMEMLREGGRFTDRTLRVFEMVALEGVPAATVAETIEMTVEEVYRVKNRVTGRLREIVAQLTEAYSADA